MCEHEDGGVLWNQGVHKETEVTASRSDVIIKNIKEEKRILMYVATPAERKVTQKEVDEKLNTRVYVSRYNEYGT